MSTFPFSQIISDDMLKVNRIIIEQLQSRVPLIEKIGEHIIDSGGKRLRPQLTLLASRLFGPVEEEHCLLAVIIEFIHTATLLHDDVVDSSDMRRGRLTANAQWGNEPAVLVGDFLYSRAFQMMVNVKNMVVMDLLAETTNTIAEGEVLQLLNCKNPNTTEAQYNEVIICKTAKLFQAAAKLGAICQQRSEAEMEALSSYGMHLGIAFQLVDDALDYHGASDAMGKNIGDDLAEGKPTLPLIRAIQQANEADAEQLRQVIKNGGEKDVDTVLKIIQSTDALQYTLDRARQESESAISALDVIADSAAKQSLIELSKFSVARTY